MISIYHLSNHHASDYLSQISEAHKSSDSRIMLDPPFSEVGNVLNSLTSISWKKSGYHQRQFGNAYS